MKRRILSILLVLVMLVGMIPATTLAVNAAADHIFVNGRQLDDGEYMEERSSTTPSTTKPDGDYAHYSNGVLTLHNFDFKTSGAWGIYSEGDLTITLSGTNTIDQTLDFCAITVENNNLTINGSGKLTVTSKAVGNGGAHAAIRGGDIVITGGTLEVTGRTSLIYANAELTITGGDIKVRTDGDYVAVYAQDGFSMSGGTLNITDALNGIDVPYGCANLSGGKIKANVDGLAFKVGEGDLTVDGCDLDLVSYERDAIWVPNNDITLQGNTKINIDAAKKGISCDSLYVKDLKDCIEIVGKSRAFNLDGDLSITPDTLEVLASSTVDGELGEYDAYYLDNYKRMVIRHAPEFTIQPQGGTVGYNERHTVNWATDFTPVKQELVRYSSAGSAVQTQALSAGAFQAGLSYMTGGYYYRIRAYYNNSSYIESDKIYVTPDQYFSPNPQYGNTEEDIIEGITYVPNGDGTFNANVHVDLSCVDGQMLQYAWGGTGYRWYDTQGHSHYGSVGVDTNWLTFTLDNLGKNLEPGKEWEVKVYLADDYYADWEWQGYSFNYFTDTVPELKPEDVFTPAFTTQPEGGEVAKGEKLTVTWATNFTPKKLQVLKYSKGYCTGTQDLDVNATIANVGAGDEYYVIRAYYSDSKYVDSNKFYVTEKVQTYTVTFKVGTDTVDTKTVEGGKTVTAPTAPTQSGKTFLGWYTEGGQKYDFSKAVTGDITLIAKFKDNASGDVLLGDVNCDGLINAVDANLLKRVIAAVHYLEEGSAEALAADVNGDGIITAVDSNLLKRIIAGN